MLQAAMKRSGQSFKQALNQAIIRGLANERVIPDEKPFVIDFKPMGLRAGFDAARLNSLSDDSDADAFLALTHSLLNRREGT